MSQVMMWCTAARIANIELDDELWSVLERNDLEDEVCDCDQDCDCEPVSVPSVKDELVEGPGMFLRLVVTSCMLAERAARRRDDLSEEEKSELELVLSLSEGARERILSSCLDQGIVLELPFLEDLKKQINRDLFS